MLCCPGKTPTLPIAVRISAGDQRRAGAGLDGQVRAVAARTRRRLRTRSVPEHKRTNNKSSEAVRRKGRHGAGPSCGLRVRRRLPAEVVAVCAAHPMRRIAVLPKATAVTHGRGGGDAHAKGQGGDGGENELFHDELH